MTNVAVSSYCDLNYTVILWTYSYVTMAGHFLLSGKYMIFHEWNQLLSVQSPPQLQHMQLNGLYCKHRYAHHFHNLNSVYILR